MAEDRAPPDAIAVALRVGEAIESVGGAYFVGGSLASSLQGEPRATNDIDLVIDVPADRQWHDVVEVLRVSGPAMDRSYLESWADRLHLREVLGRATGEASGG